MAPAVSFNSSSSPSCSFFAGIDCNSISSLHTISVVVPYDHVDNLDSLSFPLHHLYAVQHPLIPLPTLANHHPSNHRLYDEKKCIASYHSTQILAIDCLHSVIPFECYQKPHE